MLRPATTLTRSTTSLGFVLHRPALAVPCTTPFSPPSLSSFRTLPLSRSITEEMLSESHDIDRRAPSSCPSHDLAVYPTHSNAALSRQACGRRAALTPAGFERQRQITVRSRDNRPQYFTTQHRSMPSRLRPLGVSWIEDELCRIATTEITVH